MLLLIRIDLAHADLDLFEAYEAAVLPLLPDHGGVLERRLKGEGFEAHLVRFASPQGFETYLADPRRQALQELWDRSGARAERAEVDDVVQS